MAKYPGGTWLGQTNNNSGKFKKGEPKLIVMHYTAAGSGKASASYLMGPHKPSSSAHFVVDRDGMVLQISDTEYVTWHAGKSRWRGVIGINPHAIGIEIANHGWDYKGADAIVARHKNGGPIQKWEPYTALQIAAVKKLTRWLLEFHPTIREIVGHDDIAPGRKSDPGPAFPMAEFQELIHEQRPVTVGTVVAKGAPIGASFYGVVTPADDRSGSRSAPDSLVWYKSPVLWGIAVSAIFKLAALAGWRQLPPGQEQEVVVVVSMLASLVGDVVAGHGRIVSPAQPVTMADRSPPPTIEQPTEQDHDEPLAGALDPLVSPLDGKR